VSARAHGELRKISQQVLRHLQSRWKVVAGENDFWSPVLLPSKPGLEENKHRESNTSSPATFSSFSFTFSLTVCLSRFTAQCFPDLFVSNHHVCSSDLGFNIPRVHIPPWSTMWAKFCSLALQSLFTLLQRVESKRASGLVPPDCRPTPV
jgi:hypothetical protein